MKRIIAWLLTFGLILSLTGCHMEESETEVNNHGTPGDIYDQRLDEETLFDMLFDIHNQISHLKVSFQETFDDPDEYGADTKEWDDTMRKTRKNRTFATLEKLDLRWNRCDDSTYLKEALGGDLYKIGWAGRSNGSFTMPASIGIENEGEGEFYAFDLKTNKKTSSHESLNSFIRELSQDNVTKERFAELVDLNTFLPYCAVSYLLGNPDDLRNNYNNSYIYFRADNNKAVIIPYDFDRCLGITAHWNPTGNGVTEDDPFGKALVATGEQQRSPLMLYSVVSGGYYVKEYAQILSDIANGNWFAFKNFASIYEIAQANYKDITNPGKEFDNTQGLQLSFDLERTSAFSSYENIAIREYLDAKLYTLAYYLEKTDENASATPPTSIVEWYIRADYTDWNMTNDHILCKENDLWTYTVTRSSEFRLKIYNSMLDRWYGSECVTSESPVSCRTDEYTNIVLGAGSYQITINPETETITLEEQ